MRPLDARVRRHLGVAKAPLSVVLAGNVVVAVLVIAQAYAVAVLIARLLAGGAWQGAAGWLLAITAGRAVAGWAVDVAAARASARVGEHLRVTATRAALTLPPHTAAARRTGELTALVTRGAGAVEPYLTRYLPTLVLAGVLPAMTLVAIAVTDLWAALVVLLTLPLVPVFAVLIGLTTRDRADRQWRRMADLAGHFLDVVRGLPTLVANNRGEAQVATVRTVTHRYRKATLETLKLAFASSAVLELIATISVALVAVLVGLRLAAGGLDLQTALIVLLLAPEAYWPLRRVGAEFHAAAEGTATFEAIHELTELAADGGAPSQTAAAGARAAGAAASAGLPQRGDLVLEDLDLAWPDREPVVRGLSARIEPTGLTVITGPSGSGKSTLLQAVLGELSPAAGRIRYGEEVLAGADVLAEWRTRVAQVPQRPWLTPGTVAENLRIADPEATDADLWRALEAVHLAETVTALPQGLATPLGDDGAGLSAGQRARLALARVVLADRPVVVLDEPTAHLDAETEQVLVETLRDLARTRCVIAVAHRAALVDAADHVLAVPGAEPAATEQAGAEPAGAGLRAEPAIDAVAAVASGRTAGSLDLAAAAGATAPAPAPVPHRVPQSVGTRPAGARDQTEREAAAAKDEQDVVRRGRWPLAVVLSVLASVSGVALTATAGWLIARSAEQPPVMMLTLAIVGVRTFGLARPVLRYAERLVSHDVALGELAERRAGLYGALVPLVPARTGRRGEALSGLVDDVDALLDDRLRVRIPLWTWVGVGVIAIGFTAWLLPVAALVIGGVVLVGAPVFWLARFGAGRAEPTLVRARGELGRDVHDALGSARQLVLWQATGSVLARLTQLTHTLSRAATASATAVASARALVVLSAGLGVVGAAAVGAGPLEAGEISAPMLALLVLVPLAMADVTGPLADAGALQVRTRAAGERLAELTARTPAVTDPAHPVPLGAGPVPVRLQDAAAGWDERTVLRHLDLDLEPGVRIGVTGPSGSGKSTLAAVLMRFLPVQAGRHTVAGIDVDELTMAAVRERVGLIDDDPYVFASSVVENVRLARPDADDAAVAAALRAAHLGAWLDALPRGMATRIGEGGAAVSGGERARLGLARALLADKPVLVLDEPTAHLDAATARAVADDLLAASTQGTAPRSLLWITHDGVGLAAMDHVLELTATGESVGAPGSGTTPGGASNHPSWSVESPVVVR
ncbi:thiol reductant ABC exporter subunit CydD [Nocardioides faecalis]|uniref:thiol reductant ABC exporter subunit CydD n=1 Tax=Nocardioides faecalis TaxID=2803858 RepID=UPI001F05B728|nr:thiol reductant ABC exporter subunit CydD [Nocardioides faecalis]